MEQKGGSKERKSLFAQIERDLNAKDPEILRGLSRTKREELFATIAVSVVKEYSGPIPSPDSMLEYNQAMPNGADRIFTVFEDQARHRMELEKLAVTEQLKQSGRGQIFALTIGITALLCSTFTIYTGHDFAGGVLGAGGITGLVVAFIQGKNYQKDNLKEKEPTKAVSKTKG